MSSPRRLLALDPSITRIGLAYFEDGELVAAKAIKIESSKGQDISDRALDAAREAAAWARAQGHCPIDLACEWPQVYTRDKSKGDPKALVPLAGVCVGVAALLSAQVSSYLPGEWAGRAPKDETVRGCKKSPRAIKILSRLVGGERLVWDAVKYHDAIDAIGIGLHHLGRLERRRVFGGA